MVGVVGDQDPPLGHHGVDPAVDRDPLVGGVVHAHVVGVDRDLGRGGRVVEHDVGIRTRGDHALLRVHAEHPGRRGGAGLDPALQGQLAHDDALVDEVHAVLDAADAVRDGTEVVPAQLLLVLHAERAVVRGDDRQVVGSQALPEVPVVRVLPGPQWRRADVPRSCEARCSEVVLEVQVQVLRAGLGEHVVAVIAGLGDPLESLAGGQVHEVDRRACHERQLDGPVGGLSLQAGRPGDAVVHRVGLAPGRRLLGQHVDGDAVLGVHGDQGAVVGGLLHGPQDLAVVAVEEARVGHEQLEAGDPLVDQRVHLLQRRLVDASHDHVEGVVDGALPLGLGMPCLEAVPDVLAGLLDGEVDDGRRATPGRCTGTDLEGVRGEGPAEGQLHVGVAVDSAGNHVLPRGIDDAFRSRLGRYGQRRAGLEYRGDRGAVHQHLGGVASGGTDQRSVLDERRHGSPFRTRVVSRGRLSPAPR